MFNIVICITQRRQSSAFRDRLSLEQVQAIAEDEAAAPSLILYVGYICPWATRTLIARSLLGLEQWIDVRVVTPQLSDQGWRFGDFAETHTPEEAGFEYIHTLYTRTDRTYSGRATVPVLWDNTQGRIINNESADILRIFNDDLRLLHQSELDLHPTELSSAIEQFNDSIYDSLNNGVYRAGFASSQVAYEEAYAAVFERLDALESHFARHRYAVGGQLSESDIRLFVTLARFDLAYYGLFKTNRQTIQAYPHLSAYLDRLLQNRAFSKNTKPEHIKAGYYSIKALNPTDIIPAGPELTWFKWLQEH